MNFFKKIVIILFVFVNHNSYNSEKPQYTLNRNDSDTPKELIRKLAEYERNAPQKALDHQNYLLAMQLGAQPYQEKTPCCCFPFLRKIRRVRIIPVTK